MVSVPAISKNISLRRAIVICALGYFIDVFDIQLFAVLRVPSLTELGVPADKLPLIGGYILNAQMLGMVLGAFLWGWLGDRVGRVKSLYGSILLYSVGTLACSIVHGPTTYGLLRFLTGFGLAGETGLAITLISELMAPKKRGWGIMSISAVGALGPVAAVLISMFMEWRITYIIAGCLGLILFVLRVRLLEPGIFKKITAQEKNKGWQYLLQPHRLRLFLACVALGTPLTFCWFLLNFFSVEFSHAVLQEGAAFNQKICLIMFYTGTSIGTILCALVSQGLRNRRTSILGNLAIGSVAFPILLLLGPVIKFTTEEFYALYLVLGIAGGGWAFFTLTTTESFGTNVRATVTSLMGNLLRGFSIPMIFVFQLLALAMPLTQAAAIIGAVLYGIGFFALSRLRETHGLDLDYVERLEKRS